MKQFLQKINWLTVAAICFGIALVFALIFGNIVGVHAADEVSSIIDDSPFIIQSRSNQNLVYGFVDDGSRDHEPFLFYHSNGTIQNSTFAGSVPATYTYLYSSNVSGGWDGSTTVYNGFDMSLVYIVKGRIDTFDAPAASVWMSPNLAIGTFGVSRLSAADLSGYMTVYYLGMDNELYCFCCPDYYLPSVYFSSGTGYIFSNYADMRLYRYDGQGGNGVWTSLMTSGGDYGLVLARPIREIFGAFTHNNNGEWSICPVRYIEQDSPALDNYYSDHRLMFMRYFFADEVSGSGSGGGTPTPTLTPTGAPELQSHYVDYNVGTQRYIVTFEADSILSTYAVPTASNPSYNYAVNNYNVTGNAWGSYGVFLHGSIDCPSWLNNSGSYRYYSDCSWLFFPASGVVNAKLYLTSDFASSVSEIVASVAPITLDVNYGPYEVGYDYAKNNRVLFHHLNYGNDIDLYCMLSFPADHLGAAVFHSSDFEVIDTDDFLSNYHDYERSTTGYAPANLDPQATSDPYLALWALPVAYKYGLNHSYAPPTPTPEPTSSPTPEPTAPPYVQVVTPTPGYVAPGITWLPPGFGDRIIDMGDLDTVTKDGIQQLQGSHSLGLLAACFALLPAPLQSLLWFLFFFAIVFAIVRLVLHFGGS